MKRLTWPWPVLLLAAFMVLGAAGCVTVATSPLACPQGTQNLPDCPPRGAIADPYVDALYAARTWMPPKQVAIDPVELGRRAEIPIQRALSRVVGPSAEDAVNSLAVKIWMIENAEHTVDVIYYIFALDLVGRAVLGALCDAVQRGVDIRLMVDSIGTLNASHQALKAVETCAVNAGFMRNARGEMTTKKARVQVVIFNALSKFGNINRRSHDKLLVVDAGFAERGTVITGGRNISLSYYGINADGSPNPNTYVDMEILLRNPTSVLPEEITVTEATGIYYSLLFFYPKNRRLRPVDSRNARGAYAVQRRKAQDGLAQLKRLPIFAGQYAGMPRYMASAFHASRVRLAHELANLTDTDVIRDAQGNVERNPNSIMYILGRLGDRNGKHLRFVSPYLFLAKYRDRTGELVTDEAKQIRAWLDEDPGRTVEIITNSVLSSDNVPAQAIIDMDTAPRLLLTEELQAAWLAGRKSELDPEVVQSEAWQRMVSHPRLALYQTGRLDSRLIGGTADYGKLHAKFLLQDDVGFIGTSNFDYRSRLYNNEMGFFFAHDGLAADVNAAFDALKATSYRWGSPEWLEMRQKTMAAKGKGWSARNQRTIFKGIYGLGLHWFF